jgi:hypothetical protein
VTTPRREQAFRPQPGSTVAFRNDGVKGSALVEERTLTVEPSGLFTAPQVHFSLDPGNRLTFTHGPAGN